MDNKALWGRIREIVHRGSPIPIFQNSIIWLKFGLKSASDSYAIIEQSDFNVNVRVIVTYFVKYIATEIRRMLPVQASLLKTWKLGIGKTKFVTIVEKFITSLDLSSKPIYSKFKVGSFIKQSTTFICFITH